MRLIFLGAPGAGKGTLAELLADHADLVHISTGAILREEIKAGSDLGKEANDYVKQGKLVPESLINSMLENRLEQGDLSNGYILDGYPRTLAQAKFLDQLLARLDTPLDHVVLVDVDQEVIIKRLSSRVTCSQCGAIFNLLQQAPQKEGICNKCGGTLIVREDDKEEVVRHRLEVYEENTKPLIQYYQDGGLLLKVDNSASPAIALEILLDQLEKGSE
ncbi:MAG: adenylate kinase [Eubacteriales bacterium]|nr:adenylate kinase [Clostridiales bacterium]MDY5836228.1 adenylate kinase [Eubacteriales bacterium]